MTTEQMAGGCMCGAKRYVASVADDDAYLCHCRMCQRASGNVSIAFKGFAKADVVWETAPDLYRSSPIAQRGFCAICGTTLTFDFPDSDRMDLTIASFDDPARFKPTHHFGVESWHPVWLETSALPRRRTDENAELTERWMTAVGKLPD